MLANAKLKAFDSSIKDEEIIARVMNGEKDDFEILIRRYNKLLYASAKGILDDEQDIEDVMQEAYIKAYEKLYQFRQEARFSTWLTRILIHCALRHAGRLKGKHMVSLDMVSDDEMDVEETPYQPDLEAVRANLTQAIEAAIQQLPSAYRMVFILREVEHLSVAETGAILQISSDNVKVRLHRAKHLLQDILRSEASSLDIFDFPDVRCNRIALIVMTAIGKSVIGGW